MQDTMIEIASSWISHQLRETYSICICCLNVATYKCKGNIVRDRPLSVKGGGVIFFCFVQNILFGEQYLFLDFNIRLYDKNSESDYFFFLHQNQNIFFSNIGNQNIFLEENHNPPPPPPPFQVKWSFPNNKWSRTHHTFYAPHTRWKLKVS